MRRSKRNTAPPLLTRAELYSRIALDRDKILLLCVLEVGVHFFKEMFIPLIGRIPRVCRRSVGSIENYKVLLGTRESGID